MPDNKHRFPYEWNLADGFPAKGIEHHKSKVFSCFACGGGSSMGYKLAGYDCLGGVELDPNIAAAYLANLHPQLFFTQDIREFNNRTDLPEVLYNLDVLDGSPPCSTFSMAGSREKAWGKRKQFAEGQKLQRLDDLVFVFCDTIKKLQPKVCVLENVAGLVRGNGKVYAKEIISRMTAAGYRVQLFCLNAATMGVPQRRERVFFIGLRSDYAFPKLVLDFNERPITFREATEKYWENEGGAPLCPVCRAEWERLKIGETSSKYFQLRKCSPDEVWPTVTTSDGGGGASAAHFIAPRKMNPQEMCNVSTFPQDYQHNKNLGFLCGMSVPPIMTAQISYQIWEQWLKKING